MEEKGFLCLYKLMDTKRGNKQSEKGEAQRTETDVAVQSSEGSLCSLNYFYYVRLGILCVGATQLLALLSTGKQTVTKSKNQRSD